MVSRETWTGNQDHVSRETSSASLLRLPWKMHPVSRETD
jgi:hypothetical protein